MADGHLTPEDLAVLCADASSIRSWPEWCAHLEVCDECALRLALGMEVRDLSQAEMLPAEGWDDLRRRVEKMCTSVKSKGKPKSDSLAVATITAISAGLASLASMDPLGSFAAGKHDTHEPDFSALLTTDTLPESVMEVTPVGVHLPETFPGTEAPPAPEDPVSGTTDQTEDDYPDHIDESNT